MTSKIAASFNFSKAIFSPVFYSYNIVLILTKHFAYVPGHWQAKGRFFFLSSKESSNWPHLEKARTFWPPARRINSALSGLGSRQFI